VAEALSTDVESLLGKWLPLDDVLPTLRENMAVNDGGVFILERWDCKYIDIRLDMRVGATYARPGSGPDSVYTKLAQVEQENRILREALEHPESEEAQAWYALRPWLEPARKRSTDDVPVPISTPSREAPNEG
jgi:hypothetical protein